MTEYLTRQADAAHRGDQRGDNAALKKSIEVYERALQERTRDRVPLDWAGTENNLGIALGTLGERESGTARLEEAVAAYRAALEELTRARVPLNWAQTQNNLGATLEALGERESGTAQLEQAVTAYRAALQERTRERTPARPGGCWKNKPATRSWSGSERHSGSQETVAAIIAALEMDAGKNWSLNTRLRGAACCWRRRQLPLKSNPLRSASLCRTPALLQPCTH